VDESDGNNNDNSKKRAATESAYKITTLRNLYIFKIDNNEIMEDYSQQKWGDYKTILEKKLKEDKMAIKLAQFLFEDVNVLFNEEEKDAL
jgi:RNA binding exosome subunit